jgi:hypothetical protein
MVGMQPQPLRCSNDTTRAVCAFNQSVALLYVTSAVAVDDAVAVQWSLGHDSAWQLHCFDVVAGSFAAPVSATTQHGVAHVSCAPLAEYAAVLSFNERSPL